MASGNAIRAYRLKGRSGLFVDVTESESRVVGATSDADEGGELVGYLLAADEYERIMDVYEDHELNRLADERKGQERVRVAYDDL